MVDKIKDFADVRFDFKGIAIITFFARLSYLLIMPTIFRAEGCNWPRTPSYMAFTLRPL